MNKIDFPLGVELPLRDGDVAVLFAFFEGRWFGARSYGQHAERVWLPANWHPGGEYLHPDKSGPLNIVWTPPKRKVWIVWREIDPRVVLYDTAEAAIDYETRCGGVVQEIERQ